MHPSALLPGTRTRGGVRVRRRAGQRRRGRGPAEARPRRWTRWRQRHRGRATACPNTSYGAKSRSTGERLAGSPTPSSRQPRRRPRTLGSWPTKDATRHHCHRHPRLVLPTFLALFPPSFNLILASVSGLTQRVPTSSQLCLHFFTHSHLHHLFLHLSLPLPHPGQLSPFRPFFFFLLFSSFFHSTLPPRLLSSPYLTPYYNFNVPPIQRH
jgi:hypothetical protein